MAIEVKSGERLRESDFEGLVLFKEDYPMAKTLMIYGGQEEKNLYWVQVIGAKYFFENIVEILHP